MPPSTYSLLDSGDCKKLEQVGPYKIVRYAPTAAYKVSSPELWANPDAVYVKNDKGGGAWDYNKRIPETFTIELAGFTVQVKLTPFGHLGIFPEQAANWSLIEEFPSGGRVLEVLNLFAYSGLSTMACMRKGYGVCHVDSSKGMVEWASENVRLSGLEGGRVRWIVDDVMKFVNREVKRGKTYEGFILDPPSFGRGAKGEVWKIEDDLPLLMEAVMALCAGKPSFVILTCYTLGFSPLNLERILRTYISAKGRFEPSELVVPEANGRAHPRGACATFVSESLL